MTHHSLRVHIRRMFVFLVLGHAVVVGRCYASESSDGFPLPEGAVHRFGDRLFRHPDGIIASAMSPDGKYLATLGRRSVVVWDLNTFRAKQVFRRPLVNTQGMDMGSGNLAFTPDGRSLAIIRPIPDTRDVAEVFDLETGNARFTLRGDYDPQAAVWVSGEGKQFATLSGGIVRFHDAHDGKEIEARPLPGFDADSWGYRWVAPAADRIAFGSLAGPSTPFVIDARSGKILYTSAVVLRVIQAAITPDGKWLAVHDTSGKVHIHDIDGEKELFAFDHPAGQQRGPMRFTEDGRVLYFGGQHGQLHRWDLKNNRRVPDVGRHNSWTGTSIALSPDESVLYSMGWDRRIRGWNLRNLRQLPTPDGYTSQTAIVPAPDGKHLIVADHAGRIDSWDLATGEFVKHLHPGGTRGIVRLAVSDDGRSMATGRTNQEVQIWDLDKGEAVRTIPLVVDGAANRNDHVEQVGFSPDGKTVYAVSNGTGVSAFEVATGERRWNVSGVGGVLAIDPKGRWVVARSTGWTALDTATGEVLRQVEAEADPDLPDGRSAYPTDLTGAAFTPDGARLVTVHFDGTTRIWDPETGGEVARWDRRKAGSASVSLSPTGKWVGVAGPANHVSVWELATGKELLSRDGHYADVRDVAFTLDGRGLVSNADLSPILWSLTLPEGE